MRFDNQGVLVTGASGSIGQAIARAFADVGARVALHCHRGRLTAETLFSSLAGSGHMLVEADIADGESVRALVDKVIAEFGRIHILVNYAAIYRTHPVVEVDYDRWRDSWTQVLAVNLLGAANVCYCVARHMKDQGGGRIVN